MKLFCMWANLWTTDIAPSQAATSCAGRQSSKTYGCVLPGIQPCVASGYVTRSGSISDPFAQPGKAMISSSCCHAVCCPQTLDMLSATLYTQGHFKRPPV
ncbi:hypothetical protein ABBQ38_013781 [Trebouxia sp. C0009 RCD-2024]